MYLLFYFRCLIVNGYNYLTNPKVLPFLYPFWLSFKWQLNIILDWRVTLSIIMFKTFMVDWSWSSVQVAMNLLYLDCIACHLVVAVILLFPATQKYAELIIGKRSSFWLFITSGVLILLPFMLVTIEAGLQAWDTHNEVMQCVSYLDSNITQEEKYRLLDAKSAECSASARRQSISQRIWKRIQSMQNL